MVVDGGVDGCEILQCPQLAKAKHCPLSPSERLMGILCTFVHAASGLLSVEDAEILQRSATGLVAIGHHFLSMTVPPEGFLQEFQRSLLISRLRSEAFEHVALLVDGTPQVWKPIATWEKFVQFSAELQNKANYEPALSAT